MKRKEQEIIPFATAVDDDVQIFDRYIESDRYVEIIKEVAATNPDVAAYLQGLSKEIRDEIGQEQRFKISVLLDISGSMEQRFVSGQIDSLLDKIFSTACFCDDDKNIEIFPFAGNIASLSSISLRNYAPGFAQNIFHAERNRIGFKDGTNYSNAISAIRQYYFGKSICGGSRKYVDEVYQSQDAHLCFFITDGDCNEQDKDNAAREMRNSSFEPIFFQTIVLAEMNRKSNFGFVQQNFDDALVWKGTPNRSRPSVQENYIDNANVIYVGALDGTEIEPKNLDDLTIGHLFKEVRGWLLEAKHKNLYSSNVCMPNTSINREHTLSDREGRISAMDPELVLPACNAPGNLCAIS